MSNIVYIGHGERVDMVYGIKLGLYLHSVEAMRLAIFHMVKGNQHLKPNNVFFIQEDIQGRLVGYTGDKEEAYDHRKAQDLLKDPDWNPFRIFLASARGDKVVITSDSLVSRVESSVEAMGYQTKLFG